MYLLNAVALISFLTGISNFKPMITGGFKEVMNEHGTSLTFHDLPSSQKVFQQILTNKTTSGRL